MACQRILRAQMSFPAATILRALRRAEGFVIARSARRDWKVYDIPQSIEQVIDALFELPEGEVKEASAGTLERPKWKVAHGRVFGRLFMIGGYKDQNGGWIAVRIVAPVDPWRERDER